MAEEVASTAVVNSAPAANADTTVATTDETASSTADNAASADESTQDTTEAEQTDESTDSEESDAEADTQADEPKKGADARKEQLNTEIRDLVAQRNVLRQEVERINAQVYQPATVEDLLNQENPATGEYYNRLEAEVESMRQERDVEKYNNHVAESRLTMTTEAQRALSDFPMFDQSSPDYDGEVAAEIDAILPSLLEFDPNTGQLIGSKVSIYQLYKSHAKAADAKARKAEITAQRNAEKQLSNADKVTGGKGTTKPFDKLSTTEMASYLRKKGHDV